MRNLKNGFSLVEILVVVVITGILAAIAIPKLFSTTAKAKASEVTVANATYVKMLSAYVNIHGQLGRWSTIGYEAPQSKFFRYDEADFAGEENTIAISKIDENGKVGWRAVNVDALGSCAVNSRWTILITKETSGLGYYLGGSTQECLALVKGAAGESSAGTTSTQVAESVVKKSVLTGDLIQNSKTDDGKLSLAKAIISGRSSNDGSSISGWGNYETGTTMKDAYGIEGYVLNKDAGGNATVKNLLSGTTYSSAKVITELSDVAGDAALTAGTHSATQTLYYGGESKGVVSLNAYGSREVYVKVGESGKIDGYCTTENCSSGVMSEGDMLHYSDWGQDINDPFNDITEEQYESAFASLQTINSTTCNSACMRNIFLKQNSWDSLGFDYYSQYGFENSIANIAGGDKMQSLIKNDKNSNWKSGDQTRTITQVFGADGSATPGTVYAGVSALYYGTETNGLTLYDTRKVYAKMSSTYSQKDKKYTVWGFYEDPECSKKIGQANVNNLEFWSKEQ